MEYDWESSSLSEAGSGSKHPARIYDIDARVDCANLLLSAFNPPSKTPSSFKCRSNALDWVKSHLDDDFCLPEFKELPCAAVFGNALADLTQILRDRGDVFFNEPRVSCARDHATGYRDGLYAAQLKSANTQKLPLRDFKAAIQQENARVVQELREEHSHQLQNLRNDYTRQIQQLHNDSSHRFEELRMRFGTWFRMQAEMERALNQCM